MNSSDVQEKGREEAEKTAEQMRHQTSDLAQQARQRGTRIVEEQKHAAAGQITAFAHALHRAGDELEKEGHPSASQYAHWSADRMDGFAHNLDDQEPRALLDRTERFAREQPAMFIGGAVAAGLALAWALKPPGTGVSAREITGRGRHEEHGEEKHEGTAARTKEDVGLPPRAEAEYGELATRKPGSPPRGQH